jgi:indolepyruvate ferredoxin oxidoreductase beta subunit
MVWRIQDRFPDFLLLDGQKLARDAGNAKAANTVLLGAVSKRLDIAEDFWMRALEKMVPSKALEVNIKAFQIGRGL